MRLRARGVFAPEGAPRWAKRLALALRHKSVAFSATPKRAGRKDGTGEEERVSYARAVYEVLLGQARVVVDEVRAGSEGGV